ncbi:hypothetical protein AB4Z01_04795 [Inquilinus sp. YAF38]|uniref:hypothetical protein n=1 Tax=Inquilinus sp. YAF38 TaxID=3233084 RepID=UPI003F91A97D
MLGLAAAAFGLLAILVLGGGDAAAQELRLPLPRPLRPGEIAWLEVEVGPIGRREVIVSTAAGRDIGVISPFGPRAGQEAGIYPLPLPAEAIEDGRIVVRLSITQVGAPPRVPTGEEVRRVTVLVEP